MSTSMALEPYAANTISSNCAALIALPMARRGRFSPSPVVLSEPWRLKGEVEHHAVGGRRVELREIESCVGGRHTIEHRHRNLIGLRGFLALLSRLDAAAFAVRHRVGYFDQSELSQLVDVNVPGSTSIDSAVVALESVSP